MISKKSIKQTIIDFPFFKDMTGVDFDFLFNEDAIENYPKRALVFKQGDKADRVFVIISGWVKLNNMNEEGNISAVQLLTVGDVFGIETIFDGGFYFYSAEAVGDECRLLEIPSAALKERARLSHNFSVKLLNTMSHKIQDMQIAGACLILGDASRRVACLLSRLSSWMVGKGGVLKLPYEKSVAAIQLGMNQSTFSRALAQLEDLGVKSDGSEIIINDFSTLSGHCCSHCPIPEGLCDGRRMESVKKSKAV